MKHSGLLYELLGGSPMPIYNDVHANPEKYQPEDVALLETVLQRGPARRGSLDCGCPSEHWDLSEVERKRLDQMAFTFATAPRIEPPPVVRRRPPTKPVKRAPPPAPVTELAPYWWLK